MIEKCKCIMCPVGCEIEIISDESGNIVDIKGGLCERGKVYALERMNRKAQILTTTVSLSEPVGQVRVVPVKSLEPVDVSDMRDAIRALKEITIKPPVKAGDVIAENVLGKGITVVATRSIGHLDKETVY